jgi:hypothetical protein
MDTGPTPHSSDHSSCLACVLDVRASNSMADGRVGRAGSCAKDDRKGPAVTDVHDTRRPRRGHPDWDDLSYCVPPRRDPSSDAATGPSNTSMANFWKTEHCTLSLRPVSIQWRPIAAIVSHSHLANGSPIICPRRRSRRPPSFRMGVTAKQRRPLASRQSLKYNGLSDSQDFCIRR